MAVHYSQGAPMPERDEGLEAPLKIEHSDIKRPFFLVHNAVSWNHYPGRGWRPFLREAQMVDGGNGVTSTGTGDNRTIDARRYKGMLAGKDSIIIEDRDRRLSPEMGSYLRRRRTESGAMHHFARWDSIGRLGNRNTTKTDESALDEFTDALLAAGIVEPMSPEVLDLRLQILDNRLTHLNDERRIKQIETVRAMMVEDWEQQFNKQPEPEAKTTKAVR